MTSAVGSVFPAHTVKVKKSPFGSLVRMLALG